MAVSGARLRALQKAEAAGVTYRAGGFSGEPSGATGTLPKFARALISDRCIARGLLGPAGGFNQYSLTGKGKALLGKGRQRRRSSA